MQKNNWIDCGVYVMRFGMGMLSLLDEPFTSLDDNAVSYLSKSNYNFCFKPLVIKKMREQLRCLLEACIRLYKKFKNDDKPSRNTKRSSSSLNLPKKEPITKKKNK